MKVSDLTNFGARLIDSTAPHSRWRPWHESRARQDTELIFQMEVAKIEELLYNLSAVLHVRQMSVTPLSFPPNRGNDDILQSGPNHFSYRGERSSRCCPGC